jgi:hypothetical protein
MERSSPNCLRCFEDVICINCVFYEKHPDPEETMNGFCKYKCDVDMEVRWDDWCGQGNWIYIGGLISAANAALFVKSRDELNKQR